MKRPPAGWNRMLRVSWRREEPGIFEAYLPRSVDDARRIRFEQVRAFRGVMWTFLLRWRWQRFEVSADGPHQFPPGGTRAWMHLQVFPLADEKDSRGAETTDEDVVLIAIEALIMHGSNGEGLRRPDRRHAVLHQQRLYSLDEHGRVQFRAMTDDEQRGFREQRDQLIDRF